MCPQLRFLTNTGSGVIAEGQDILVDDITTHGRHGVADLSILPPSKMIAIVAHSVPKEIALHPDGSSVHASVHATAIYDGYGGDSKELLPSSLTCNSLNPGISTADGCSRIYPLPPQPAVTETHPGEFKPWGLVSVSTGGRSDLVPIMTHVAISLRVVLDNPILRGASCGGYQITRMRKMAVFDNGNGSPSPEIDVSNTVYDFAVQMGPEGVASVVDSYFVGGVSPGRTTIHPMPIDRMDGRSFVYANATVADGFDASDTGSFAVLSMETMVGIDWERGSLLPSLRDMNPLIDEGDSQIIFPMYKPAGMIPNNGLDAVGSVSSTNPVYTISEAASSSLYKFWVGEVRQGALGNPFVGAVAFDTTSECQVEQGGTNISLPVPSDATLSMVGKGVLAVKGDPCSDVYAPSSARLFLTAVFSDATTRILTADERTEFVFVQNPYGATIGRSEDGSITLDAPPGAPPHEVLLYADILGGAVSSNTISVEVVTALGIQNSLHSKEPRDFGAQGHTLYRIHCSPTLFQGTRVEARLMISDGGVVDLIGKDSPVFAHEVGHLFSGNYHWQRQPCLCTRGNACHPSGWNEKLTT